MLTLFLALLHVAPAAETLTLGEVLARAGDRPAALTELMGIILNEGIRYPTRRFERLRFAEQTPL